MKYIFMRFVYLIVGWLIVGIIYSGTAHLQGEPTLLSPSIIDEWIAFTPHAIWFYLSFFLIIPWCFFIAPYKRVAWMCECFIVSGCFAGLFYLIFPTTVICPVDTTATFISSWLLEKLISVDVPVNCFPSLHVTLTFIVIWGCLEATHPIRSLLLILWGIAIVFSVIQLRRHLFIDFIGGVILALFVGWFVRYCFCRLVIKKQNIRNCYYD